MCEAESVDWSEIRGDKTGDWQYMNACNGIGLARTRVPLVTMHDMVTRSFQSTSTKSENWTLIGRAPRLALLDACTVNNVVLTPDRSVQALWLQGTLSGLSGVAAYNSQLKLALYVMGRTVTFLVGFNDDATWNEHQLIFSTASTNATPSLPLGNLATVTNFAHPAIPASGFPVHSAAQKEIERTRQIAWLTLLDVRGLSKRSTTTSALVDIMA